MTRTSPPQVAFSSGELDPLLHQRFDYQRFQTGLAACRGFLPLPQGGFTRAPGTLFKGLAAAPQSVLLPFVFAANDAVVLEFSPLKMRVWRYGALVMDGAAPYEIATPYPAESLPRLQWVQSADVIYLADGLRPIQRLARFALDNWTIGPQTFNSGPFRVQNLDKTLTMQASASTGTITLTASAAYFSAADVGTLMRIEPADRTSEPLWVTNEAVTAGTLPDPGFPPFTPSTEGTPPDVRRYRNNTYIVASGTNSKETPPQHTEGTQLVDKDIAWKFVHDGIGIVRITGITSPTLATAEVLRTLSGDVVDLATYRWSPGAWSDRFGYPAALELYDQRLVAAATPSEPRTIWFSAIGDFADFNPGTDPDSPFAYTIAGDSTVNQIQTLRRGRSGLHIFALGEEYIARAEQRQQSIGVTTIVVDLAGAIGASPARPISPDGNPIYISRDRRRLMLMSYSLEQDANRSVNLSLPAQHFGGLGFAELAWQAAPQRIAWARMETGDLTAMIYDPDEEVLGWALLPLGEGAAVKSLAVTPDATGTQDVLTLVIERQTNQGGASPVPVTMIEELALTFGVLTGEQPATEACHLFSAQPITAPGAVFAAPQFYQSAEVYAWTDQGEFGPLTVAGGSVTLPVAVSAGFIGLTDPRQYADTLSIFAAANDGNTLGRSRRLHAGVGLGLHRAAGGWIQSVERDFGFPPRIGPKMPLVPQTIASPLLQTFTGTRRADVQTGSADDVAIRITPQGGAPLTITALVPTIKEAGR